MKIDPVREEKAKAVVKDDKVVGYKKISKVDEGVSIVELIATTGDPGEEVEIDKKDLYKLDGKKLIVEDGKLKEVIDDPVKPSDK